MHDANMHKEHVQMHKEHVHAIVGNNFGMHVHMLQVWDAKESTTDQINSQLYAAENAEASQSVFIMYNCKLVLSTTCVAACCVGAEQQLHLQGKCASVLM